MVVMKGSQAIMEIFRREGVEYIFGLPGSTEAELMDPLEDNPDMKYILCLHENIAVGAAEGYSRTSGKVGVVILHTNTGLSSGLPMLLNAYVGRVPLLLTAGNRDTRLSIQEPAMGDDLAEIVRRYTKWSCEVRYAEDVPVAIQRAFKVALQPPTGPVFVSLPMNVMGETFDFEYVPGGPVFSETCPDPQAIAEAVELLAGAKNPAILVGPGVARNGALDEVVKLAELTGARVYQQWMCDICFPTSHPQYVGDLNITSLATREILQSVDVLTAIGDQVFGYLFYLPEPLITAATKLVQIDDNPWEIGKNFPVASGIHGHIRSALVELNNGLQTGMTKKAREAAASRASDIARETDGVKQEIVEKARQERDSVPISVSRLLLEVRDALKPGTMIIDDSVSAGGAVRNILRFSEPGSFKRLRGGGSIGWAMPGAIGTQLAAPDRPVVALSGDGGAIWSNQSLWTAAHYNLPITVIVFANTAYDLLKLNKHLVMGDKARGRYLGMDFNEPRIDFCQIAQGMGVSAHRVERPEELKDVLSSAFNSDKPNLIEVHIASISLP